MAMTAPERTEEAKVCEICGEPAEDYPFGFGWVRYCPKHIQEADKEHPNA